MNANKVLEVGEEAHLQTDITRYDVIAELELAWAHTSAAHAACVMDLDLLQP